MQTWITPRGNLNYMDPEDKKLLQETYELAKKNQNILGLAVGCFLFIILFFINFRFDFEPYFSSTGSIAMTYVAGTISYIFVPRHNGWLQGLDIIWWILVFIYLYFIWKYRSCLGYWTIKIIQLVYKKI